MIINKELISKALYEIVEDINRQPNPEGIRDAHERGVVKLSKLLSNLDKIYH